MERVEQRIIPGFQEDVGIARSRDSVPASELNDPVKYRQIGVDDVARVMVGLGIAEADTVRDYMVNLSRGRVAYVVDWRDIDLGATHILLESIAKPEIRERFQSIYGQELNHKTLWVHGFGGEDVDMEKGNYKRTDDEQILDAKAESEAWERLAKINQDRDDYLIEPELEETGVLENEGNDLESRQDLEAKSVELSRELDEFDPDLFESDLTRLVVGMSIVEDMIKIDDQIAKLNEKSP